MNKKVAALSAALIAILMLAGCTTKAESSSPAPAPATTQEAVEEQPEAEEFEGILAFGETATFEDGVAITVTAPEPYKPSELSAGVDLAENIVFTITITNGSDEKLEPFVFGDMTSGGVAGSQIFDSEYEGSGEELGVGPSGTILPGKSISWREAWSVNDAADLQFELSPGFDYQDIIFITE